MILLITFGIAILLIYVTYKFKRNTSTVPKGMKPIPYEKGLPIIGIIHQVDSPLPIYLTKLSAKHGPLFKVKMGMRDIIIINNNDFMKKTLKEDGDNFSGRFRLNMVKDITHDSGIVFREGDPWAKQRSFVLTVLRDFGLGKSKSVEIIQGECQYLLEELEKSDGKPLDFSRLILYYTGNVISKFIMNKRFEKGDRRILLIDRLIHDQAKEQDHVRTFFTMFPAFDSSNLFVKLVKTFTNRWKRFDEVYDILRADLEEHTKCLDLNSEGDDLIDRFLLKQHEMKETTGSVDTFTTWQLIRIAFELFAAGYETTSTTLGWACLFLSRHPDIQKKVYSEIMEKVGDERMVTMSDKTNLHYTQAVMDEVFRVSSVLPLSVPHRTLTDSSVEGYFIPRNSVIFTNLFACHHDPMIWENPMDFNPERFLSVDSNGIRRYTPRKELIPFGMGRRQCLGESLARMELFIFLTSILQKFEVIFSEKISDKDYDKALIGNIGSIRYSFIKNFIFKSRYTK